MNPLSNYTRIQDTPLLRQPPYTTSEHNSVWVEEEPGHRFWVKPTISRQGAQESEFLLKDSY